MVKKTPAKKGTTTKVTFELHPSNGAEQVHLCGDFNEWSVEATPMTRRKDGRFSATVTLEQGRAYRYRYLIDGEHWENDEAADGVTPNAFGTHDCLVNV